MTDSQHAPIFVIGYMHSGTTLLQKVLANSPGIYASYGETRFFTDFPIYRSQYPDLQDDATLRGYLLYTIAVIQRGFARLLRDFPDHQFSLDELDVTESGFEELYLRATQVRDHAALYPMVFDLLMREAGKQRWLEKTPTHLFYIDEILAVVPDARFVELVRDPRDILSSKKTRKARGGSADPIWDTLAWKSAVEAANKHAAHHGRQILRVRYRDLTARPEATVREICHFLDLPFEPALLQVGRVNATSANTGNTSGITTAAVGRWKRELRPNEAAAVQWIAGSQMRELGFELPPASLATRLSAGTLVFSSIGEFFERLYRRWQDGGAGYLRNVFRNYGKRLAGLVRDR